MKRLENGSFQAKIRQVVNLCGDLAGAKRLACICVCDWQEGSDWLVFVCVIGRRGATGLYLCVQVAGAERLACIWVVSWQERSDWLVFGCGGELAGAKRLACIVLVLLF